MGLLVRPLPHMGGNPMLNIRHGRRLSGKSLIFNVMEWEVVVDFDMGLLKSAGAGL